jgi:hypothetical protein
MRRAAREDERAERECEIMIAETAEAEAEDVWWSLRGRRRNSMEAEMIQHVLGRERAVQTNHPETNGIEREGSEESSDSSVAEARERGPTIE